MTLLAISFIAGVLTVLAPCILPLLPVVVGGSASDHADRKKPYVITAALSVSVIVFTLLLKASTLVIDIPPDFWKWFSGGMLLVLGFILVFPAVWENLSFNALLNRKSQVLLAEGSKKKSVWGDVLMGAALGPVFTTCSPTYFVILATVLPSSFALGLLYLFSYTFGLALMLIAIALLGQRLVGRLTGAADPRGWVKRGMGVLIICVGLAIMTGFDKKIETALLDVGYIDVTTFEQMLLQSGAMPDEVSTTQQVGSLKDGVMPAVGDGRPTGPHAPELAGIAAYLNTEDEPITLEQYRGNHVVLVDFWTYSCINCRRTTPYLVDWYKKYKDEGLVIVGVHTPEFAFEKVTSNVTQALQELGIEYPVVLDNDYATWNAFKNRYWPRKYLIDEQGVIIYDHTGEGGYEETERAIQDALTRLGRTVNDGEVVPPGDAVSVDFSRVESPEVYFGASRNEYLANGSKGKRGTTVFTLPSYFDINKLYLGGSWNITDEYAAAEAGSELVFQFSAKNVYMVLGGMPSAELEVFIDGAMLTQDRAGSDVHDGMLRVEGERLYHLYSGDDYSTHTLRLKVRSGTLSAFTFTFG